jgi:CheY-like chemotaxis protein
VKLLVKAKLMTDASTNQDKLYCLRFQIEDTGLGMTEAQVQKIFLPFEQVGSNRKQAEGTGLGLAISHKIIDLMGSQLEVQSQLNQGSLFWFDVEFPEAKDWVKTSVSLLQGPITGYEGHQRTILVVDDRWENRSVIANLLGALNFQIIEATNGKEGLEKAAKSCPDLIITDISMPVLDGYEMLEQLRQSTNPVVRKIPTIVSSASVFESDRHKSFEAGANEFLPKPIQAENLLQMLENLLNLTWQYEKVSPQTPTVSLPETTEIIVPPADKVKQLYELSRQGLVNDLIHIAEQFQAEDPQHTAFLQKLIQMATKFQLKQMRNFLAQNIPE